MIIIVGASASGKTELANSLITNYDYTRVITTTTRNPRRDEIDKVDYFFKTKEDFLQLVDDGHFAEHVVYNNNYYGTSRDQLANNKIIVLEPSGVNTLLKSYPNAFVIYLMACKSIRKKRMITRGDTNEEIKRRLFNDKHWFNIKGISKIHLKIKNNRDFSELHKVAKIVHLAYQEFISKQ